MKTRVAASQIYLPSFQLAASQADEAKIRQAYANDGATSCEARISLELKYASLLTPTDEFNRKPVSYFNKTVWKRRYHANLYTYLW
jgi:hypothetical protein